MIWYPRPSTVIQFQRSTVCRHFWEHFARLKFLRPLTCCSYAKWTSFADPEEQINTTASQNDDSTASRETFSSISASAGLQSETTSTAQLTPVRVLDPCWTIIPCNFHNFWWWLKADIEKIGDIAESRIMEYVRHCRQRTQEVGSQG